MIAVASALGTSISYLYGETDDPRPAREWHTSPSSAQQHALSLVRDQLAQLRAGLIGLHCHDLRHTFCSRLAMRGVPLNTIRELAGHADMAMTLRYAHLSPDHQAQAIRVLDT